MSEELIIGKHPVNEAIQSGREINKVWINKESKVPQDFINKIKERGITVQFVPRKKLDQLTKTTQHQGIVASIAAYEYAELEDLFALSEKKEKCLFSFCWMVSKILII